MIFTRGFLIGILFLIVGCTILSNERHVGLSGTVLSKKDSTGVPNVRVHIFLGDTANSVNVCLTTTIEKGEISQGLCPYKSDDAIDSGWVKLEPDSSKFKKQTVRIAFRNNPHTFYLESVSGSTISH
jgi:hypothetical protein